MLHLHLDHDMFCRLQQTGDIQSARECWEKASQGHRVQNSLWHAASALEKAADLSKESKDYQEMESLYMKCADLYLEEGRPQNAAQAVSRAGTALSEANPDAATALHLNAIKWIEESEKEHMFPDIYRQAILHSVKSQRWEDAVRMELQFAVSSYSTRGYSTMCKSYLSAIIIALYSEKGDLAWETYQDALGVPEFSQSDQAFAAQDIIHAYDKKSKDALKSAISRHSCFQFLDNCIIRLVKSITNTNIEKTADSLGRFIATRGLGRVELKDDEEEDLT